MVVACRRNVVLTVLRYGSSGLAAQNLWALAVKQVLLWPAQLQLESAHCTSRLRLAAKHSMAPENKNQNQAKKRTRKRKRRVVSSSSSSSSSSSDSEHSENDLPRITPTASTRKIPLSQPQAVPESSSSSDESDSSSSSASSRSASPLHAPHLGQQPEPSHASGKRRERTPTPPPPMPFPSFLPTGEDKAQREDELRAKFRKFWMASVADAFKGDLEQLQQVRAFQPVPIRIVTDARISLGARDDDISSGSID